MRVDSRLKLLSLLDQFLEPEVISAKLRLSIGLFPLQLFLIIPEIIQLFSLHLASLILLFIHSYHIIHAFMWFFFASLRIFPLALNILVLFLKLICLSSKLLICRHSSVIQYFSLWYFRMELSKYFLIFHFYLFFNKINCYLVSPQI